MPLSRKVSKDCANCGDDNHVWMFEKEEGKGVKECYTCEACGCEWSEIYDTKT
jgi:DNA-directed RNA polymerase subunit M/transcription elongation factor TFIIS